MKKIIFSLLSLLTFISTFSQSSAEDEIRNLEKMEGESFVKKDTITLFKLLSPDFVVNRPINKVGTLEDIKLMVRSGKINISSSEKIIEKITFIKNMAILMGDDFVKPQGEMANPGKKVRRKYTDVWIKDGSGWKLTVRQAQ